MLRAGILLLVTLTLSGCYVSTRSAPYPMRVTLEALNDLPLVPAPGARPPEGVCVVRRGIFDVTSLTRDTLHYSRVEVLQQPDGAPRCTRFGPGVLALGDHPDLQVVSQRLNGPLSIAFVAAAVPVLITTLYVLAFAIGGPSGGV